ncbi:hypothetical protein [Aquella oligotrophica]|uniref:Uncharacterized protein n=1 Tax=Aquella oligotrophica TaxID=2067065 RepID=A0A2I7N6C6_9NEIS|nr:hypothetical protein [Aquella oligotrophica]AUR52027.1 hypothetical protein CUN60_06850 [Aquella oligotrophica]
MKNLILIVAPLSLILFGCGKNVGVQDVQEGAQHISNIMNGKNASEVIANLAHASNDISLKMKESGIK